MLYFKTITHVYQPNSDFVFLTGCAFGLDDKRGILIGGHHVIDDYITESGHKVPIKLEINDQVLEIDIEDISKWNFSKVPLQKVPMYRCTTVRKLNDSSIVHLETLNFDFYEFLHFLKTEKFQLNKIHSP